MNKNILLISHVLSLTGAPVALHYMAREMKKAGDFVTVLCCEDGPMASEMLKDDITVIIDPTINGNKEWLKWARKFDLIVVCTVVAFHNIEQLMETNIPVLWWIHDGEMSFQLGANAVLPQELTDNIHPYCGGEYCCRIVNKYRPSYHAQNLLYCVPDSYTEAPVTPVYTIPNPNNYYIISSIASIDERKGEDVLVEAIEKLSGTEKDRCLFCFFGKNNDNSIYKKILKLKDEIPDHVLLVDQVSRTELLDVYRQSNVVVCSSRDDPMPVVMTESLMFETPVICTDCAGTYALLEDGDGVSGLTFHSENSEELSQKLSYAITNQNHMADIGRNGRKVYEEHFTEDSFKKDLKEVLSYIIENK